MNYSKWTQAHPLTSKRPTYQRHSKYLAALEHHTVTNVPHHHTIVWHGQYSPSTLVCQSWFYMHAKHRLRFRGDYKSWKGFTSYYLTWKGKRRFMHIRFFFPDILQVCCLNSCWPANDVIPTGVSLQKAQYSIQAVYLNVASLTCIRPGTLLLSIREAVLIVSP